MLQQTNERERERITLREKQRRIKSRRMRNDDDGVRLVNSSNDRASPLFYSFSSRKSGLSSFSRIWFHFLCSSLTTIRFSLCVWLNLFLEVLAWFKCEHDCVTVIVCLSNFSVMKLVQKIMVVVCESKSALCLMKLLLNRNQVYGNL